MLPTVNFLGHTVTRLIVGDNPFNGHTYIPDIVSKEEFLRYHTEEHILETWREAENLGFNTLMPLGDPFILRALRHYQDMGGKLQTIFQPFPPLRADVELRMIQDVGGFALYHQGTTTDYLFESGRTQEIRDTIAVYHDAGFPVGLGTHRPDVIRLCEDEGWDVDFYVACLQNARRQREGEESGFLTGKSKKGLVFYPEDRPIMLDLIAQVDKPCIAFKVFAGGQMFSNRTPEEIPDIIRGAYREVFSKIKPGDIAAIGVYQERKNQLAEDAKLFLEIMEELEPKANK